MKRNDPLRKLRALVLYFASASAAVTVRSLNGLLYYCDFAAHRSLGESITGSVYVHASEGPALRAAASIWKQLCADGVITLSPSGGSDGSVATSHRPANLMVFLPSERKLIQSTAARYPSLTAEALSATAQREPGWRLTRDGEEIPYRTAWLSADELTEDEIHAGREIAAAHGPVERTAL